MTKPRLTEQPWKVPVAVSDVPETGKRIDLAADAATRGAIAKLASVVGVPRLEAQFDLTFQPDDAASGASGGFHALDAEDPPEPLRDGVVDLGAVATEFLLLGIDPYPRKPGVVFDAPTTSDPSGHPFAALAALKKDGTTKPG